jgi:hypothetical protein
MFSIIGLFRFQAIAASNVKESDREEGNGGEGEQNV